MDIFVARQPILTNNEEIIGYELLYRNSHNNAFTHVDGDAATIDLLLNSFIGIGNQKLSKGKKLFINFTRNLLIKRIPTLFSPDKIVIEILETVEADTEVLEALTEFKQLGYTIALDDFFLKDFNKGLIPFADIIKVDFLHSTVVQRKVLSNMAKNYNLKLLAEKIETRETFHQAQEEGFHYFQGYFFSKPVIISSRDVPIYSNDYMRILNELNSSDPSIDKITTLIQRDLSLSYRILKIVNTMAYYTRVKITSIRQAILILGLNELMKLLTIISLKDQQPSSPIAKEIFIQSLIRARLAEQVGSHLFGDERKSECFMLGMFSLLDTILQQPMQKVLDVLPLSDCLKYALLGKTNEFTPIMELIIAVESADWEKLSSISPLISTLNISVSYENSIKWATDMSEQLHDHHKSASEKKVN